MANPHIQPTRFNQALAGQFALEGRQIPDQLFTCYLQADTFDTNQTYWIQKESGGSLYKVRIEGHLFNDFPSFVSTGALNIDLGRSHQKYALYSGNIASAAQIVEQDLNSNRRYKILMSIGS